jgi:hypothetical protein
MTEPDESGARPEVESWAAFVDGLRKAGERLAADTAGLAPWEQADGFRALIRGLHNQLARFEVDRERPELVAFNGWRQKFFLDNPDFRYWVADIRADRRYRVTGARGAAAYLSITAYAGSGVADAEATARLDSDSITFDETGAFTVVVGGERPPTGDWMPLPERATALWVRHFHGDVRTDELGWCAIEPLDPPPAGPPIDADRFNHHLRRLGTTTAFLPSAFASASAADAAHPNELRVWSEMTGGAAYTEPDIHYVRGGWQLDPGEALVVEGDLVTCRYWNVLLHSRFLNSLDHRYRPVSRTGASATVDGSRYRFVLAGEDPGPGPFDWLDTEGRPFGIVVMRWLQPRSIPELPGTHRCRVEELASRW